MTTKVYCAVKFTAAGEPPNICTFTQETTAREFLSHQMEQGWYLVTSELNSDRPAKEKAKDLQVNNLRMAIINSDIYQGLSPNSRYHWLRILPKMANTGLSVQFILGDNAGERAAYLLLKIDELATEQDKANEHIAAMVKRLSSFLRSTT